jgi:peptidylprolyl isomerase
MPQAQNGDTVNIHYTGKLDDGTIFDSSVGREPLEFQIGSNQVIPGFERAVIGMAPGDAKSERIPADQAYGDRMEDMVVEVDRSHLPADLNPEIGMQLSVETEGGGRIPAVVTSVTDDSITIDANHPLAGQALTFEIELVTIA